MRNSLSMDKQVRFTLSPDQKQISSGAYNFIVGLTLLYGFAVNALMISNFKGVFEQINQWVFLIGYIVCVIVGAMLTSSKSPVISFIGYNFIVVPLGMLLTMLLPVYSSDVVFRAIVVTGTITLVMMLISSMFPAVFLKMGRALFITLIACILVEILFGMVFKMNMNFMDYIIVLLFCGYIGYDWARANAYQKTVDNAIDSAVDLYMDIINIFVRILAILQRNN